MKTVFIIPNRIKPRSYDIAFKCAEKARTLGFDIFAPDDCVQSLAAPWIMPGNSAKKYDLTIIVGGDGSILHNALDAAASGTPVVGVNVGTVGFMAELEADELDLLENIADGRFWLDTRRFISAEVRNKDGELFYSGQALNDAVIGKRNFSRSVKLTVLADGREMFSFRGDGAVISTPTGSTAYSLSAGGPILHPECDCVSVTPVSPHAVRIRSAVYPGDSLISVRADSPDCVFSIDGKDPVELNEGSVVSATFSSLSLSLVRVKDRSFYDLIKEKLI